MRRINNKSNRTSSGKARLGVKTLIQRNSKPEHENKISRMVFPHSGIYFLVKILS